MSTKINSTIKVDKGIPLPPHQNRQYPFSTMEVGDSFFSPKKHVRFQTSINGDRLKRKFASRAEKSGVRIWRIA